MFIEWYDVLGNPRLSYLSIPNAILVLLCGYGKWVPKSKININKER